MAPSIPVSKTGNIKGSQTTLIGLALQTGTGVSVSIAHGLGYTPTRVFVSPDEVPLTVNKIYALGTHDATSIAISAYSDMSYYVYAF